MALVLKTSTPKESSVQIRQCPKLDIFRSNNLKLNNKRDIKYCKTNIIRQLINCSNLSKNLILVPTERYSVVLRHANLLFQTIKI